MNKVKKPSISIILKIILVIVLWIGAIGIFFECLINRTWKMINIRGNDNIYQDELINQITQIRIIIYITLIIGLIVIFIMLISLVRRLGKVKKAMEEIACGNLDTQMPIAGNYDISNVAVAFDEILRDLVKDIQEKDEFITTSYKFIPYKMFEILNKNNIMETALEDQTDAEATILTMNTDFFDYIRTVETREMFAFINRILSRIVPEVLHKEGIIDKFIDTGLTALFIKNNENALKAGISICKAMLELDKDINFSVGLCYGSVMIGIVGHEERQSVITISAYTGLSSFLQSLAGKYGSRILVTSGFVNQIKDFDKKYYSRFIGYFYIRSTDTIEKIYDIFDGDIIEEVRRKKKTKVIFERGVELYTRGKFEEARLHFIEVLKVYRMDSASKEYLYLCDYFSRPEHVKSANVYIEIY